MKYAQLLELARIRELSRGGAVREARLRAGLSLSEVAVAVGVSPATIYRWETAQRRPGGAAALRYARLYQALIQHVPAGHGEAQD